MYNYMHHDGCHSFSFASRFDRYLYDLYDIPDLYFASEFYL